MNKRLLVALMPFLIQTSLYCDTIDIDQMIMPQLERAQKMMNSNTAQHLQPTLNDLVIFAGKGDSQASQAVDCMKSMKATLAHAKEEELKERTYWDWFCGTKPENVEKAIDPAIDQINNALNKLSSSSGISKTIAASALGIAAVGIAGAALWYSGLAGNKVVSTDVWVKSLANKLYYNVKPKSRVKPSIIELEKIVFLAHTLNHPVERVEANYYVIGNEEYNTIYNTILKQLEKN